MKMWIGEQSCKERKMIDRYKKGTKEAGVKTETKDEW